MEPANRLERDAWVTRVLGAALPGGAGEPPHDPADFADAADSGAYARYLRTRLRTLRRVGTASFGFAAGSSAAEHRLAVASRGAPRTLAARMQAETGSKQVTWGVVTPHPEQDDTLVMELEGRQLPGLAKKCGQLLRRFRPQPARRVVLRVGGAEVDDVAEDDAAGATGQVPPGLAALQGAGLETTPQTQALAEAAAGGLAFCEECGPSGPAAA